MSTTDRPHDVDDDQDPWERVAEHRDTYEMLVEEETAFAERAKRILDRLDEEGY